MVPRRTIHAVALTGGIATGKSTCLRRFASLGVPTIDSDQLARDAVRPGTRGLDAIIARFGTGVLDSRGALDRRALGAIVFEAPDKRSDLEAIIHPEVFAGIAAWRDSLAAEAPGQTIAVADVPLLFETHHEGDFDSVVVATCAPDVQLRRLMERDRLTRDEAVQRIAAQWPLATKCAHADFVIETSGSISETERQVDDVLARLRA